MRRLTVLTAAVAVALLSMACGSPERATQGRWGIRDLGTLGGPGSEAVAINERGEVVGRADAKVTDKYGRGVSRAFLWQDGRMTDLGTFGGPSSSAYAINDRGQVVGNADTKTTTEDDHGDPWPVTHAFLWQNGKLRDLGTLGGEASQAYDINERGQVIGWSDTKSGVSHAFLWQNGKMRDLGVPPWHEGANRVEPSAINARGQVVGTSYGFAWFGRDAPPPESERAFFWKNGKMTDLGTLGGQKSWVEDLNDLGQVVGCAETGQKTAYGEPDSHAFLWENGRMRDLGTFKCALRINERGQVLGSTFVWENAEMHRIGALGGPESYAAAINNSGQVVGKADTRRKNENSQIAHAVLWTYTP